MVGWELACKLIVSGSSALQQDVTHLGKVSLC